jgi:putative flippase GtrA
MTATERAMTGAVTADGVPARPRNGPPAPGEDPGPSTSRAGTPVATPGEATAGPRASSGRWAAFRAHPLTRRVTGYSAGSVIAAVTSELAFAAAYGWGHTGTTAASAIGFVGGAVPNYLLNRRWAWRDDRRGRSRGQEAVLYMAVAVASFVASALATAWADDAARSMTPSADWRVALVALTYLAVSGVFFAAKFVLYELVVFTESPPEAERDRPGATNGG